MGPNFYVGHQTFLIIFRKVWPARRDSDEVWQCCCLSCLEQLYPVKITDFKVLMTIFGTVDGDAIYRWRSPALEKVLTGLIEKVLTGLIEKVEHMFCQFPSPHIHDLTVWEHRSDCEGGAHVLPISFPSYP